MRVRSFRNQFGALSMNSRTDPMKSVDRGDPEVARQVANRRE